MGRGPRIKGDASSNWAWAMLVPAGEPHGQ